MTICPGSRLVSEGHTGDPRVPLERVYRELRIDCCDLEELLERADDIGSTLSAKDVKRLDKAVTVMKVAFKIMKKVVVRKDSVPDKALLQVSHTRSEAGHQ